MEGKGGMTTRAAHRPVERQPRAGLDPDREEFAQGRLPHARRRADRVLDDRILGEHRADPVEVGAVVAGDIGLDSGHHAVSVQHCQASG